MDSIAQRLLNTPDAQAWLETERVVGRAGDFAKIDTFIGNLVKRIFQGEVVASLSWDKVRGHALKLEGLTSKERTQVNDVWGFATQQARGALYLPESVTLKIGTLQLPYLYKNAPRYANGIAQEMKGTLRLEDSAGALLIWSLLEPLCEAIFAPFDLRSRLAGKRTREEFQKAWAMTDQVLAALGVNLEQELSVLRYGGGWHRLTAAEQTAARERVIQSLARQMTPEVVARYRAWRLRDLVAHYLKKAKPGTGATRKQVLTKALERTLSGYFGGDWLAFLRYIEASPHPDEQVVTALPETTLYVGASQRAVEIAAAQGLPVEEVERMLAAFWQQERPVSPVIARVEVLQRYWRQLEMFHARQRPGMPSLWGFVEEGHAFYPLRATDPDGPHHPGLYRTVLPVNLLSEIQSLWGTVMLPRWPERIVSTPTPHRVLADALGPALKFWHGIALTAWFICEGPYSRTDMKGASTYYARELAALTDAKTPVPDALFRDLVAAERRLGPEEPIKRHEVPYQNTTHGISITMSIASGTRRAGFEGLRDIILQYLQAWTQQYLDTYLRYCWESEIQKAARHYLVRLHEKGKAPTVKQFAPQAVDAVNHWFGGDIAGLYTVMGEKCPVTPTQERLLPSDPQAFVDAVFIALGGKPIDWSTTPPSGKAREHWEAERDRMSKIGDLASESLHFLQLQEALGEVPTRKVFGEAKFEYRAVALSPTTEEAWQRYVRAMETTQHTWQQAKNRRDSTVAASPPPKSDPDSSAATPPVQPVAKKSWLDRLLGRK